MTTVLKFVFVVISLVVFFKGIFQVAQNYFVSVLLAIKKHLLLTGC